MTILRKAQAWPSLESHLALSLPLPHRSLSISSASNDARHGELCLGGRSPRRRPGSGVPSCHPRCSRSLWPELPLHGLGLCISVGWSLLPESEAGGTQAGALEVCRHSAQASRAQRPRSLPWLKQLCRGPRCPHQDHCPGSSSWGRPQTLLIPADRERSFTTCRGQGPRRGSSSHRLPEGTVAQPQAGQGTLHLPQGQGCTLCGMCSSHADPSNRPSRAGSAPTPMGTACPVAQ